MPRRPPQFEFRDEFAAFLPAHGVPKAGANYITWMNRAVKRLGHSIGPADLCCEADVQTLMGKLLDLDQQTSGKRFIKNPLDEKNQRSTFRKYAQMVQSNRGLFTKVRTITASALLVFARKVAGQSYRTLRRSRPFVVDVVDGNIVSYPESGEPYWMETDDYVRCFNQHNSLRPGDYPKTLWSNSYFVALVDAMLNGTEPIPDRAKVQLDGQKPEPPSPALDAKVRQLRLKAKVSPPAGSKFPKKVMVKSLQTVRDPAVKAWVLNASDGKCSYCLEPAPFKDDDGLPFLEVHHVRQLADGGSDMIENAVAICPNCHRACHHSKKRKQMVALLYKRYARLKK